MFRTSPVHHQERFVQPVFADWYVVIRVLLDTSSHYKVVWRTVFFIQPHNIWTYRVVRKILHTKFATYSLKTLLRMDYWGPKHVELTSVTNKLTHKTLYVLLDYIYILQDDTWSIQYQLKASISFRSILTVYLSVNRDVSVCHLPYKIHHRIHIATKSGWWADNEFPSTWREQLCLVQVLSSFVSMYWRKPRKFGILVFLLRFLTL